MPASLDPVAAWAKAQADEYSAYVALEPIDVGGARAFNTGDPVPKGHVDNDVVSASQVAKRGTQAADAATTPKEL